MRHLKILCISFLLSACAQSESSKQSPPTTLGLPICNQAFSNLDCYITVCKSTSVVVFKDGTVMSKGKVFNSNGVYVIDLENNFCAIEINFPLVKEWSPRVF